MYIFHVRRLATPDNKKDPFPSAYQAGKEPINTTTQGGYLVLLYQSRPPDAKKNRPTGAHAPAGRLPSFPDDLVLFDYITGKDGLQWTMK
ncbi:MAG: hypothetical protein LUE11_06040 [Clostridia bacterium]|nr:hypothetical protein [Clostridia bacterium]